ncbi:7211_t:CDS:2 [Gigaspora rosea]|nr:7211_t:CDS:2 [Gigaspora rosea]
MVNQQTNLYKLYNKKHHEDSDDEMKRLHQRKTSPTNIDNNKRWIVRAKKMQHTTTPSKSIGTTNDTENHGKIMSQTQQPLTTLKSTAKLQPQTT